MRECVFVWLDSPLTISLLCQLWVGEGKQMVVQKGVFLADLAALYLTLVSESVSQCHFRTLTQRGTFET